MFSKSITASVLALSLAVVPAERSEADIGDFVGGVAVGAIGSAIVRNNQRQRTTTRRYVAPRLPSTQEGRQIQSSLNYFGFNAGTVDGQLGRRSRDAISSYQAYLGYPVTGQLTPFEQNLLVTSHNRAQAGGYATNQLVAANPDGTRGLLKQYRAEMAGQTPAPAPGTTVVVAPAPTTFAPPVAAPSVVAAAPSAPVAATPPAAIATFAAAAPAPAAPAPAAPVGLPNFMGNGSGPSLTAHCNTVSLLTNTNGGFTTVAAMTDPNAALNEQFCLARTYAISNSENLIAKVQGFTPAQIVDQCKQFGPAMQPYVASLSAKSEAEVTRDVAAFIPQTGMPPAQLKGTAQICMGVGYRIDDMDVALGSALMLYAAGDHVYGELMGHHLAQGFGTTRQVDAARVWYAESLKAIDAGAPAVFAPGQPERTELLRKASMSLGMETGGATPAQAQPQPASLPTFGIVSD
ncbi:peptidoglycan-binding domain-containing protein [Tateyamaria pelophila]|uniref:peptidoglycan-binding domain-containing protein n=1 Tax=Tateyamaria pelophila TaxID=328415 RepID=UPI001CBB334B|nr:peptidoglycan-binding domain-containing protein [Tateyamaria pelophila]